QDPSLCTPGVAVGEAAAGPNACSDGIDNDGDGMADCADSDCNGQTCRPASGTCDLPEVCTNGACPADSLQSSTHECRPKADSCDVAELCPGDAGGCPPDGFAAQGVQCA